RRHRLPPAHREANDHAKGARDPGPALRRARPRELLAGREPGPSAGADPPVDGQPRHALSPRRDLRVAVVSSAARLEPRRARPALDADERPQPRAGPLLDAGFVT